MRDFRLGVGGVRQATERSPVSMRVARILSEEISLSDPWPTAVQQEQAMVAAEQLLDTLPRAQWPQPASEWERLVVALAIAVLRVEGSASIPRLTAVVYVRDVLRAGRCSFGESWG